MTPRPVRPRQIANLPPPAASLFALALSAATTGALIGLSRLQGINKTTIALTLMLPVGISATVWGLAAGIVAATASFLAFNYFFILPLHTLVVHDSQDLVILAAFLFVAVTISELAARVKRNLEAAQAHEREAVQLYELSTTLAGLSDENAIATALLERVIDTFQADRVEIVIEAPPQPATLARGMAFKRKPDLLTPLQTARGLLGEIRIWREAAQIQPGEERLLEAFASQCVLAIERARLSEQARRAKVLAESDRFKSSLLSSVSHELRTPLATVKAAVSSLKTGDVEWDSEARTDLLAAVEEEVDHLNILVGNLLDISRIESGSLQPDKKPNSLRDIALAALGRLKEQAKNHTVILEIQEEFPLVNVDFVQMQQVFTNLLTNSLKYAPPGSEIRISSRQAAQSAMVTLTNHGPNLPPDQLERIFDKFYRTDASSRVTGTGLGLSICKGILEAHAGRIWAENLPDGMAFHFRIPL